MSIQATIGAVTHQTFELKLLEHCRLSERKEAYFYRIGSAALLMLEVNAAKKGPGWCICNVIMLSPQLIGSWNSQLQMAWERALEQELQRGSRRFHFVFHWHRTVLLVNEDTQAALEEILSEQFASTVH